MVMRTIEIKEISMEVDENLQDPVFQKLQDMYGNRLKIRKDGTKIRVSGDLRNYKMRRRILFILSGGKHGSDL
ncbi:MAG: hypothetical protein KAU14_01445 [Thermoplasmata archaeon]|nr:hypothetical protein [Thermoplasmata archaeon]